VYSGFRSSRSPSTVLEAAVALAGARDDSTVIFSTEVAFVM
jgi:hypothetical protein